MVPLYSTKCFNERTRDFKVKKKHRPFPKSRKKGTAYTVFLRDQKTIKTNYYLYYKRRITHNCIKCQN